jgi:multiple sugar transport system permease protein
MPKQTRTGFRQTRDDTLFILSIVIPILLLFLVIRFIPIGEAFVDSFTKRSLIRPGTSFVGLANYKKILFDPVFHRAFWNTIEVASLTMFLSVVFGLTLASVVNSAMIRGLKIFQALLFLPVIVSLVPATLMWKLLFDYNSGFLNYLLNVCGAKSVDWINDSTNIAFAIITVSVWKTMGYNMMIFLVGLKAIPAEYYEAASLDGASRYGHFRHITLPLLRPITLLIMVISIIMHVKIFTQAVVMSSGSQSSGEVFKTLVYYVYQSAFQHFDVGLSSAAAMALLVLVFGLTLLQLRISKQD